MACKRHLLNTTALSALFLLGAQIGTAHAAELDFGDTSSVDGAASLPAVSSINAKIEMAWGGEDPGYPSQIITTNNTGFDHAYKLKGAVTLPLAHSFGIQFDGVVGSVNSKTYTHAASHLFWRDPAVGLLGAYGSLTRWDTVEATRFGVEGELYSGQFTLSGVIGSEWGDVDNGLFSIADLGFYASDNLKLSIGHRYTREAGSALAAGLEYQFYSGPGTGASFFVDSRFGHDDYQSVFAGLKLYFGADKSLIRRHREDDPDFHDEDQSVVSCVNNGAIFVDSIFTATDSILPPAYDTACNDSSQARDR